MKIQSGIMPCQVCGQPACGVFDGVRLCLSCAASVNGSGSKEDIRRTAEQESASVSSESSGNTNAAGSTHNNLLIRRLAQRYAVIGMLSRMNEDDEETAKIVASIRYKAKEAERNAARHLDAPQL